MFERIQIYYIQSKKFFFMIEDCIKLLWYGSEHPLIRQLFERFFTYIAYHFPHVFGAPFNRKYESIPKT
jgi:hypothetical protein